MHKSTEPNMDCHIEVHLWYTNIYLFIYLFVMYLFLFYLLMAQIKLIAQSIMTVTLCHAPAQLWNSKYTTRSKITDLLTNWCKIVFTLIHQIPFQSVDIFSLEIHVRVTKMQENFNRSTQPNLRAGEKASFSGSGCQTQQYQMQGRGEPLWPLLHL